ncbi:hypothetical protein, partial [Burkholderia pyrrocinia]|uniref:hypothetical protein n=1 Tax=Burkholderia pyrrocinia TaxID=60550 RepID=UPI001ABBCA4D
CSLNISGATQRTGKSQGHQGPVQCGLHHHDLATVNKKARRLAAAQKCSTGEGASSTTTQLTRKFQFAMACANDVFGPKAAA